MLRGDEGVHEPVFDEISPKQIQSLRCGEAKATIFRVRRCAVGHSEASHFHQSCGRILMSDLLQLELTDRQRELLLRGLRFVRSSRMLEIRESSDITDDQRKGELGELRQLAEMLAKEASKPGAHG
jgi:hypothetical protein